ESRRPQRSRCAERPLDRSSLSSPLSEQTNWRGAWPIMSRTSSTLLLTLTLLVGMALGVALDRGGPFVAAQASIPATSPEPSGPANTAATAPATALSAARDTATKPGSEDELYRQLDAQYEQFRKVD